MSGVIARRAMIVLLLLVPAAAQAQGVLVVVNPDEAVRLPRPIVIWPPHRPAPQPEPPASYKIKAIDVQARLVDQVAQVQVSQSFVNTGSRQLEVSFIFPLPYDGAIESMTLMVDGKEFPARLLNAEEARRLYEEIVRKNRDPALLEWMGTGLFRTSVFPVPPGQERTVSLRYSQLLRKQEGLTDFLFPLSTAKYTSHPVEKVNFRVTIESEEPIKNVYSPTHEVSIKRPDSRHATVSYQAEKEIPGADFRLLYDVGQGKVSTRVISYRPESGEDGYFLLLASPEIKASDDEPAKKTVLFVLDRSGSMSGKKIEQARAAARFLVENLRQGDLFNMIAYDSAVEAFRPELQRYDSKSRQAAIGFVEGIYAGGSTNINGAMTAALGQLQDSSRPSYVLFLSDGLPTTGVTSEAQIVANARKANQVRARTFCFGVGYDVNSRLLDKLARDSNGYTEYVRPDEDIEDRVSRLYRRIESPVMTGVEIAFEFDDKESSAKPVNRLYPKQPFDLFAGDQLVVVGRYKQSGAAKVTVRGSVGGESQKFDFSARLVKHSDDQGNAFIEKLWAIRRVGEIIDELDLNGRNEELVEELVRLSTRHGILTPYTSFLADENVNLHDTAANAASARSRLSLLEDNISGQAGFEQRAYKGSLQRADRLSGMGGYPASAPALSAEGLVNSVYDPAAAPGQSAGGGFGVQAGQRVGTGRAAGSGPAAPGTLGQGMYGAASADAAQTERSAAVAAVQQIGSKTFFRRNNQWVDSTVTEKQQQNVRRVKQFSDEYFALARRHGRDLAQYLAMDDPVMVNIEGEAWLIEP